jgi:hypothetical protein
VGIEDITPRWLRLPEAARYASIGQKRLIRLAEAGAVVGYQDPADGRAPWIFDRLSLDRYREGLHPGRGVEIEAREILASVRR